MDGVDAPVLHIPPIFPESVTLPPSQNEVGPLAEIVEAVGNGLTVTTM